MSDMEGSSNKNNSNQCTMSDGDKDEWQNNSKDRTAAQKEEIEQSSKEVEALKATKEELTKRQKRLVSDDIYAQLKALKKKDKVSDQIDAAYEALLVKKNALEGLAKELKTGHYFAKAHEIFPPDKYDLIERSGYKGAADKTTRQNQPVDKYNNGNGLYALELKAFLKHLDQDASDASEADMNSVAPSGASDASEAGSQAEIVSIGGGGGNSRAGSSKSGKSRDRIRRHMSGSQQGVKVRRIPKVELKRSIIPDKEGHKGHQLPDGATCAAWWALVCLWVLGEVEQLEDFYGRIEKMEANSDERLKLEGSLRNALVLLATGTNGGSPGMRSSYRNILYVPDPHTKYYATGYNWIIIPIMTLDEIKDWNGDPYEVAIFVGEHDEKWEGSEKEPNNHFQDRPAKHSAVAAEAKLFGDMEAKHIEICSKEDLTKVTNVLTHFLKAFADLHTRSCNDNGTRLEHVSPRNWGIIDLSDAVEEAMEGNGTGTEAFAKSKEGIEHLITKLSMNGSDSEERGGIRVPKDPKSNCFGGKHVFKASVAQAYPPDPIFVAAKGTVNFGRQRGIRLLPGCPDESSLDSSCTLWSGDEDHSDVTPLPFKDFTGFEIAVVTPESLHPDKQAVIVDADGLHTDALSDVSIEDFATADGEEAL